jgi:hypothetical protein
MGLDSFARETRWLAAYAGDRESGAGPVQPFGLVQLARFATACTFGKSQQNVWFADRPNTAAAREQNPYKIAVAGPQPIDGYGVVTQDWPALVAFSVDEPLALGQSCGPKAGSYLCSPAGTAFVCLGYDGSTKDSRGPGRVPGETAIYDGPEGPYKLAWIAPNVTLGVRGRAHASGTSPVAADARVAIGCQPSARDLVDLSPDADEDAGDALVPLVAGWWHVGFGATLSSTAAPRGEPLELTLEVDGSLTSYKAYRLQDIELDGYDNPVLYTAESVAWSGIVELEADTEIAVVNSGAYETAIGGFYFWMRLVDPAR